MNVGHATDPSLQAVPERTALVVDGQSYTYRQLEDLICRAAGALQAAGVGPGDRVALVSLGSALSVATIYAAARLGAASAQMNAYLTSGELAQLAELVGARVGVAANGYRDKLSEAMAGRGGVVLGEAELFAETDDRADGDRAAGERADGGEDDTALVLFTSGTTGLPKPIWISHRVVSDRLAFYGRPINPDVRLPGDLMSSPIFHIGGTLGMFISLYCGRELVLLPKFDAGDWLALVERYRVAQTFLVPTMLRRILDHPKFAETDLNSLRALSYGAAAAPVSLIREALEAFPDVAFSNTFGQTETLGAYSSLGPEDHRQGDRLGSVGKPFPGVTVKVVDPATGEPVPPGEPGEFWVQAVQNTTSDWLHTGDIGWQDAEGYLYCSGRLSDTINRGGEKFGPIEVEEVLRTHPGVADVGVVGVPDEELGERVGAVVVTAPGATLEPGELIAHCAGRLATYKVPEYLIFADELPISALGKLDRRTLRTLLDGAPALERQR